jgi:hypothetical protein
MGKESFEVEQSEADRAEIAAYFDECRQMQEFGFVKPTEGEGTVNLRPSKVSAPAAEVSDTFVRPQAPATDGVEVVHLGASADQESATVRLRQGREASTAGTRAVLYFLAGRLEELLPAGFVVELSLRKGQLQVVPPDFSLAEVIEAEQYLRDAALELHLEVR